MPVAKRECGSCRFFEQSGIGESGYCRNPRCREIVGLALVRRQELACRISWDQDYFEPIANPNDVIPGQTRPIIDPVRQRSGYQGVRPDDIIVGIEQPRPLEEPSSLTARRPRTSSVSEAHQRALDRRNSAQQTGEKVAPRRLTGTIVAPGPDAHRAAPMAQSGPTPESSRRLTGDEGVSLPRRAEPTSPPPGLPVGQSAPELQAMTRQIAVSTPAFAEAANRSGSRRTPTATPPPRPDMPTNSSPQWSGNSAAPPPYRSDLPAPPMPNVGNLNGSPLEIAWYAEERQRHRGKRCANCRDFQMAESNDRGWCKNRFAFPTPQLVGPNDLACLSCIGTWWAANDQWWMAKILDPQEAMPTPNADALIEEMREEERRNPTIRRPGTG